MSGPLKLKAADAQDLAVISTCLQDSVVPVIDMTYQPAESRFLMVANRFRWEDAGGADRVGRIYERVHCGVRFDHVTAVRLRDVDRKPVGQVLSLLAVEAGERHIDLIFAGRGVIRLEVDRILCHLDDLDEPWPTRWKPAHPVGREH